MKAKKIMGMIACASACVSLSAFGNTTNGWFGVTASGSTLNLSYIATNHQGGVTIAENRITLENDKDTALKFTPDPSFTGTNRNDGVYVIKATALLTPSSTNAFDVIDEAKAGFAVGIDDNNVTNYYGYANSAWHKYDGATVVEGADTTFKIVLNYRDGEVEFYAGPDASTSLGKVTGIIFADSAPLGIDAFGSGSISSITGGYEVAVAAYDNKKYGSITEALAAGGRSGDSATIKYIDANGDEGDSTAANGLDAATCIALGIDATSESAVVRFVPADSDTDASKVTLKVGSDNVDTSLCVTYSVHKVGGTTETQRSNDGTVKIPTDTGVYTITPTSVTTTSAN